MAVMKNDEELKARILNGLQEDDSSPISKNGKMRFDQITISNLKDSIDCVKVEFIWRGKSSYWLLVEGTRLNNDAILVLSGIIGEQGFRLA